jgi:hypothetical protein
LGSLTTCGHGTPAVSTLGQGTVDVVRPDLGTALLRVSCGDERDFVRCYTIVRSSLAELDSTQEVSDSRERAWYSAQRLHLLRRGLALVICVQDSRFILRRIRAVVGGRDIVRQAIASLLVEVGS